jgi:pimeloyl-ACP methyl ester carboxylesterase
MTRVLVTSARPRTRAALLVLIATAFACRQPAHETGATPRIAIAAPSPAPEAASDVDGETDSATVDSATGDAPPDAAPALAPLPGFFEGLPVAGYPDAWLSLPTGATSKRPVVVLIHGAGDRPDWQCGGWRHATDEYAFIVCPRGHVDKASSTKNDVRYTHIGGESLLAYVDASLEALAARYPDYVDTSMPLYAGFSLGAAEIVALAVKSPSRFPRLALVEGATTSWSNARVDEYLKGGGKRVLYGCGQEGVRNVARSTAKRLVALGLDTRVVYANVGHTFDPPLEDAVRSQLAWLLEGDERWSGAHFDP